MAESPHSPGTMTQLSRAHSTTELIAYCAGQASSMGRPAMPKARESPSLSFLFAPPCCHPSRDMGT
ncbi:hypothetical protein AMTR_s00019p00040460 [Amborella trichopoda]|uniref:Uncharacterized protein n=1 Tax=Amborella trichopoda TaxID=13333 RepID=W1PAW6_AMBTC|nr:hypothetical protein AMTR_s00019p00040460 [Amborella trichopoda]